MTTTQHRCHYQDFHHEPGYQQSPTRQNRERLNLTQPKRQWSGFTLIELMICLSLIATLSTLPAPRLLETVPELVLERQARQLQSLLSNARTLALVHDSSTIVCPANTTSIRPLNAENALAGDWCDPHGNWQTGVNVVLDRNQNRSIDAADNLVFHLAWYTSRGLPPQIQWRSFRDGDQIDFLPTA